MTGNIPTSELLAAVSRLSPSALDRVCSSLARLPSDSGVDDLETVALSVSSADTRQSLSRLFHRWRSDRPTDPPSLMAACLHSASAMDAFHRQRQVVEVIWTGPTSDTGTLRKTEQALLQLIDDANHSLWILTFVAYKAEPVMDAIERAVARGVKVSMVAESERSSEGRTAFAAADAMRESLAGLIVIYEWPAAQRDRDQAGNSGTLHAKGALADERVLLVSSANLTDHALRLNIELGVLIRGGEHPGRLAQHLNQLVATGVLRPCSCP